MSRRELRAYAADGPTALAPLRVSRQFRIAADSAFTIPRGESAWRSSTFSRVRATYAFDKPLLVGLELAPLVSVSYADDRGAAWASRAFTSFDHRYVEVGVDAGVRSTLAERVADGQSRLEGHYAFEAGGFLRVGTRDGLHVLYRLGGTRDLAAETTRLPMFFQLQAPLSPNQRVWLLWRAGIGHEAHPYAQWFDLGIRVRVTRRPRDNAVLVGASFLQADNRSALGLAVEWRSRVLAPTPRRRHRKPPRNPPPESGDGPS